MAPMEGRTVVVTGASSGIGAAAARQLHRLGASVVPVGRSVPRTGQVAREIAAEPMICDFAELDQVRRLADQLAALPRIDVLVNNAGAVWPSAQVTGDGFELTWQVNHLAPFLLTVLLRERLQGSSARVITTSSDAHKGGRIDLDTAGSPVNYRAMAAYGSSKLANILFTAELQRRWGASGVVATCVHPGVVGTRFGRDSALVGTFYKLARPFLRSSDKGADTLVWLASSAPGSGWEPGGYHLNRAIATPSPAGRDVELARQLWELSAEQVGIAAAA